MKYTILNVSRMDEGLINRYALYSYENDELVKRIVGNNDYNYSNIAESIKIMKPYINDVECIVCLKAGTHIGIINKTLEALDMAKLTAFAVDVSNLALFCGHSDSSRANIVKILERVYPPTEEGKLQITRDAFFKFRKDLGFETNEELIEYIKNRKSTRERNYFTSSYEGVDPDTVETVKIEGKKSFEGKVVIVTGTFDAYPDRKELEEKVRAAGGRIVKSVSKKLNIIVLGDNAGASKMKQVAELREQGQEIEIIKESDLAEYW